MSACQATASVDAHVYLLYIPMHGAGSHKPLRLFNPRYQRAFPKDLALQQTIPLRSEPSHPGAI